MTLTFDDILQAICTRVQPSHANETQRVYVLEDAIEAKLAYDILVAYGFEVKLYPAPGKPSKLYITAPAFSEAQLQQYLSRALLYANALKKIKLSLDELCAADMPGIKPNSFTIGFVNASGGKQIMVQISQSGREAPPAVAQAAEPAPAVAAKVVAEAPRSPKKMKKTKEDDLDSGPSLGRTLYPAKIAEGGVKKQTLRQRILFKIFGNFATSGYAALMWLVVAGVLFSFFIFAKGWLCYDFVAKKSTKWYCQDPSQISAEEARKSEQEERQKKLGLAPVQQ